MTTHRSTVIYQRTVIDAITVAGPLSCRGDDWTCSEMGGKPITNTSVQTKWSYLGQAAMIKHSLGEVGK